MIRKFFDIILWVGYGCGFEDYYQNLQRNGLAGVPTADEARKDYRVYMSFINKV